MCNNNGHCRQFDAGTMCPSYRVTRDEQHLTRGRANTLRLALSGTAGPGRAHQRRHVRRHGLCVGCKGCKRECPTGIDMARMKIEFLAHYKARHGYSLKDRLIAHLPDYSALASRWPRIANLRDTLPGARRLGERLMGISAKRSLPRWRRRHLLARSRRGRLGESRGRSARPPPREPRPWCCLWTPSTAPSSARTPWPPRVCCAPPAIVCTHRKAERAGPAGHFCCGRTFLAAGMVERARDKARELAGCIR